MIVRSARRKIWRCCLGFADYITPIEHFFVRTHVLCAYGRAERLALEVEGDVATRSRFRWRI
jgi:hypothetical protein